MTSRAFGRRLFQNMAACVFSILSHSKVFLFRRFFSWMKGLETIALLTVDPEGYPDD